MRVLIIVLFICTTRSSFVYGQLSGIKYIPGDYATITLAVNALNAVGPGSGGVTFNVAANYTETIGAPISLTATGTIANPIIFQKDSATTGANPLITAYTGGTATPTSSVQDGIWRMSGSDYVTINGIDVRDNPANTTNPATMEYGYALYKQSSSNGCQFVTIKNCTITLSNINNASSQNPMTEGCAGILVMNASATTAIVVYGPSAGGGNSNNKFYGNVIQNCNYGISMPGATDVSPFANADTNNDIGGNSSATGNTILNFGGAPGATNPAAGIRVQYQYGLNVSYNTINNNNGAGTNHPAILRGIQNNTAVSAGATISHNTITVNGGGTTQNVYAIDNAAGSTAANNTINITNNTITNCGYSTATTGSFYGIYNTATPSVLNINSNTFTGNSTSSASGLCIPVYNSGAVVLAININNNNVGNSTNGAVTFNAANSATQSFIYNSGGASTAALSISNNNIQGVTYAVQGTGLNNYIINSAATLSQAINNNTFTALNVNTTGNITFISNSVIVSSTGTQDVNGNSIVTSFNKAAAGGTVTLFTSTAASVSGGIINNNNNNFSNITVTGATIIDGWVNTDAGAATKTIQNNTFSNWTAGTLAVNGMNINLTGVNNAITGNSINNILGAGAVTGIATAAGNDKIYSNTINTLSSTGALAVTGILVTGGTNKNIYSNKIYDLQVNSAGGTVSGISVTGTTVATANIYNNLIGDLRSPLASTTVDVVRGISITETAVNSTINVYYNTIYLNAVSTGINFSSSGIYHTANATATTALLNLRNNSITNISTPKGSGLTVAYRRSGTALNNYASSSNNNLFYAGSAGANRLIFYDGTNADQILSAYKTRVFASDAKSVTEDLITSSKFLSTSGSSASFLHLNPGKATQSESGAANIANFTMDYDGQNRQGNTGYLGTGTAPDIGADEADAIPSSPMSGTYNVGAGQTFTSLTNAGGLFAAINSLGLSGNVVVNITSDLAEDGSNTLYQWVETGSGNYTLTIQPDAATVRIVSGDVISGLIRFNGARRVIIDGSNGSAGNYLTFRNTNTAGTTGTAFTFINGASNNTIKYCNTEAFSNATNGVILFSTSAVAGGNSNNLISNCSINATVGGNTGSLGIYSLGTTGNENSTNTISNNNIFNYRDKGLDIAAIGSKSWTINNNSFYNGAVTGSIDYAASTILYGIRVLGGGDYSIVNNYIGGSATLASGGNASYSSSSGNIAFYGITVTAGTGTSNIKGNVIRGITVSSVPAAANANEFVGIETIGAGMTNVGGLSAGDGNTIGSNTANGSIIINTNTTAAANTSFIRGIYYTSTNAAGVVAGNQIAGFDISNTGSSAANAAPSTFQGITINTATAPSQVNSNTIGSTGTSAAANSIRVLSGSAANGTSLTGVYLSSSVTSTVQVNANIIQNLSQQVTTVPSGSFYGIYIGAVAGATVTVTNNSIKNNSVASSTAAFYGIWNNASPTSITINSDTISNNTSTAGTAGLMYGVFTQGSPTTVAINNNTFAGNTVAVLNSSPGFVAFYNNSTAATLSMNYNAYYGNATSSTSGATYFIRNTAPISGTINIDNNTFGTSSLNAITFNGASTSNLYFIDNTAGASTASLSISNNRFQGINYAAGGTGGNTYINNLAATLSQAINGNTFINLNVNTTGYLTFISNNVIVSATGTQNVNNNSIVGTFTKAAGNTITFFNTSATSVSGAVINNNNNNFSNITVSGATPIAGWINTDAGNATKTLQNNTFSNWTGGTGTITAMQVNISGTNNATTGNLINNISSAGAVTGIATGAGNDNIFLNTINALSTTGSFPVNGISITAGTTKNIYKNKIYDLQAGTSSSGTVNGILVSGGTTVNIYNNLIGNLRTPAASVPDPVRGISVTSVVAPSTINVYYNTVYLNATSTGTNFGSTGIYHLASTTATTSSLNLRNNSITNTSTPNGTGYTVCYRLNSAVYNNYAATSDNNLFYAGTPGAKRLIFWEGTTGDPTLAAYKTRVATRDAASVTEDITAKFLSTTGSSPVYLHMDSAIASAIKNGAVNIAGYTDDFDGQIRFGNTGYTGSSSAPSIGADEVFGIENVPPTITYIALTNTTSTTNRAVTGIIITDASGINTAPGTKPRIYYKRFSDANTWLDNTSSTNGWKYAEASNSTSPYTFTIDYSVLSGGASVTAGAIQYFVVAQDLATIANVAINSGTFTAVPSGVALTSAAFPVTGSINSYNIAFSGTYNVGTSEVYTSLTKADGLFAAINSAGLMGNTTFNITSDLTEDGTNALNKWTESGAGNYTLTIKPDVATLRTISGSSANGLIRLNGADRVTIDGSNAGSGVYLSFINTNTAGTTGTAFTFVGGAANNTIRYCDAEAYANAANGVILFNTSAVAGGNSNNLIDNCTINATVGSYTGDAVIYSSGTVGNENASNTISNNSIYGYKSRGLDISTTGSAGWTISGNSFYNGNISGAINYPASSSLHGIRIQGGTGYSILNNYIGGSAVSAAGSNALYSSNAGNVSFQGILITTTGATPASNIKGNTIAAISVSSVPSSAASTAFSGIETNGSGINIGGTSAGEGNLIGSAAINSSIIITTATVSAVNTTLIKGINCASTGGIIAANQVAGLDINNIGTVPASSSFSGLFINAASAPSQVINNIVGSRETSNSIRVLASSGANATSLTGISIGSAVNSNILISGNMVENISQLSLTSSGSFSGISNGATSGTMTISADTVQNITAAANANAGSTVYNGISSATASSISNNIISNISLSSTGVNAQVTGISVSGAVVHSITGNFISDLTTASSKASASAETSSPAIAAVTGILNAATVASQIISGNTLYNLNATNASAINTVVTGIGITATVSGNIYSNRIASFTNQATGSGPGIIGVMAAGGSFNLYNNSIKIDNSVYVNGVKMYGIVHAAGSNWNYFYNSVSISGNASGTSMRSSAFIRPVAGSLFLRNNVFVNTRTGTGSNYAISNLVSPPASGWSSSASDYNDLYSRNANTIAEWGLSNNQTFAQWQTSSGGEANSVSRPFSVIPSPYDLQPDISNCSLNNAGIPITSPITINTDLNNISRSASAPDMGAYEFTYTAFAATASNNSPVCAGSTVNFTADPGIAMNAIYSWTSPSSAIVSTVQNPNIAAVAGTYTVKVTDGNGCFSLATTDITLTPTPTSKLSGPAFICAGNTASLSITLTGSGTINGTLSSGDIFSGSASTITVSVSPSVTTPFYITNLSDANCTARPTDYPDTVTIQVLQFGDWRGVSSTDWNDAANWSCGGIPAAGTSVTVRAPSAFYPVITGSQTVNNITIVSGASLTVTGTLIIAGAITNNGTFTTSSGTISMNGATDQTIPSGAFAGGLVKNLVISNNVALAGPVYISGTVSFGNANNKTLTTAGHLTLGSAATATARVADITNGGINTGNNISGLVTAEKYIPAKRAYRLLASPVNSTGSIRTNWMENTNNPTTSVNYNPAPGYGIHISGSGGDLNGFDATATNNPSLFTFDNVGQAWSPLANTALLLTAGNAYRVFVRGSRSTDLSQNNPTPTNTTLRVKGTLLSGTISMQQLGAGGTAGMPVLSSVTNAYSFIGNPYASPVDWLSIEKIDIGSTICIFDPTVSGTNGRGAYVTYNATLGVNNNASSFIDNNIQSWQSFFVMTSGPNPSLTFRETHKSNLYRSVFRTTGNIARVTMQLLLRAQALTGEAADGLAAYYSDDFSDSIGAEDSYKFTNLDENIGILRDGKVLSIEGRKTITENDTLPVKIWQLSQKPYMFKIGCYNIPGNVNCYLEDSFLNTQTLINAGTDTLIPFTITSDSASAAADRFRIVFKVAALLPLQSLTINAYQKNKGAEVEWSVYNENNISSYEVERSADLVSFVAAIKVQPSAVSQSSKTYSWYDDAPVGGDNFYRIKSTDQTGIVKYSQVVKVHFTLSQPALVIYPNPVEGNTLILQLKNLEKGSYTANLVNDAGEIVYSAVLIHDGTSSQNAIKINTFIARGIYTLQLTKGDIKLNEQVMFK